MKIAVVTNPMRNGAVECAREVTSILEKNGCEAFLETGPLEKPGAQRALALSSCDMLLAVGGDGTIIHTAKLAASLDKPILGINAGRLGFTAGLELDELSLLPGLLRGEYREERRLMVAVRHASGERAASYLALNDAVVSGETASLIDYWMALGENRGYLCRADGFIVATPTGSTAYSLSAGGPVIQPDMDCLVYTPVCSHALFSRSVVFGGGTRLAVTVPENLGRLYLTVDGEKPVKLSVGDKLLFSRAERAARFVRLGKSDFYDVLNRKILAAQ